MVAKTVAETLLKHYETQLQKPKQLQKHYETQSDKPLRKAVGHNSVAVLHCRAFQVLPERDAPVMAWASYLIWDFQFFKKFLMVFITKLKIF